MFVFWFDLFLGFQFKELPRVCINPQRNHPKPTPAVCSPALSMAAAQMTAREAQIFGICWPQS